MDKETLSNYGWIVICTLVLAVMLALATPFGDFVANAVKTTTKGLFDVNQKALNSTGLMNIENQDFNTVSNDKNSYEKVEDLLNDVKDKIEDGDIDGAIDDIKDKIEDGTIGDVVDDIIDNVKDNIDKEDVEDAVEDAKDFIDDKFDELNGGATCNILEHKHITDCYLKTCDHKNGHIATCYETVIGYEMCTHSDATEHTASVTLGDVVTINGTDVQWKKDHPAYSVVYRVYKKAYDEAYAKAKYFKDITAKAAGVATLLDKSFCYTAVNSLEPTLCTHGECTDVFGTCYTKVCLLPEHTHDQVECYKTNENN